MTTPAELVAALKSTDYAKVLLFSPDDDTLGVFLALIDSAERSILIAIYGCTLRPLIARLVAKHQGGVRVRVLLDHSQSVGHAEREQVAQLRAAGVPLWIGTSPVAHAIMHAKVTVVDDVLVESGSWNYSESAPEQVNTLLVERSPDTAAKVTKYLEFLIDWVKANEPQYQS